MSDDGFHETPEAECEALRAENDRLREEIEVMIAGDRLRAERDRLREALEKIAEANWLDDPHEARRIAKAALAKEEGE